MKIHGIVSRNFLWRLLILAAGMRFCFGPPFRGASQISWPTAALIVAAIVVLHPSMDKDVPISVGSDVWKSLRTYVGASLLIATYYVQKT